MQCRICNANGSIYITGDRYHISYCLCKYHHVLCLKDCVFDYKRYNISISEQRHWIEEQIKLEMLIEENK